MPLKDPVAVPDADALLFDPEGFDLPEYAGVFILPGEPAAIIETAASPTANRVLKALDMAGVDRESVEHVLVTHIHLDHCGAAWRLMRNLPNAKLVVHDKGAPYLTDEDKVAKLLTSVERAVGERFPLYGTFKAVPRDRVITVHGGEDVEVAGRTLEIIDTPGHAPHHYVPYDPEREVFWAGDTLGIRTPNGPLLMTTPPPRFDLGAWKATLDDLESLDARWALLTHYGWVRAADQVPQFRRALIHWVEEIERCRDEGLTEEEAVARMSKAHPEGRQVYDEALFQEEMEMNVRGVWMWLERQDGSSG